MILSQHSSSDVSGDEVLEIMRYDKSGTFYAPFQ